MYAQSVVSDSTCYLLVTSEITPSVLNALANQVVVLVKLDGIL